MQGATLDPDTGRYFFGRQGSAVAQTRTTTVDGVTNVEILKVDTTQMTSGTLTVIASGTVTLDAGYVVQFNDAFTGDLTEYHLEVDIKNGDSQRTLALQYHPTGSYVYKTAVGDYDSYLYETKRFAGIRELTYAHPTGPAYIHTPFDSQEAGAIGYFSCIFGDVLTADSSFANMTGGAWRSRAEIGPTAPQDEVTFARAWGNSVSGSFAGFPAAGFRIIEIDPAPDGDVPLEMTYVLTGRVA